jgi:hypothetical protein
MRLLQKRYFATQQERELRAELCAYFSQRLMEHKIDAHNLAWEVPIPTNLETLQAIKFWKEDL